MKKSIVLTVTVAAVLLHVTLVLAQTGHEDFYNTCIDKRIAECNVKASLDKTRSLNLLRLVALNQGEAAFYRDNRDQLVKEMTAARVETKAHAVDHFLINAFFAEHEVTASLE